jgi:hypothetical protein
VTIPFGINNRGEVVGGFIDAGGIQHGFVAECDDKKSSRRGIESSSAAGRTCDGDGKAK